jgi:hypothetical protein
MRARTHTMDSARANHTKGRFRRISNVLKRRRVGTTGVLVQHSGACLATPKVMPPSTPPRPSIAVRRHRSTPCRDPSTTKMPPGRTRRSSRRRRLKIGRGGMGEVVSAHDEQIGRSMSRSSGCGVPTPSKESTARFLREARIQGAARASGDRPGPRDGRRRCTAGRSSSMKQLAGDTLAKLGCSDERVAKSAATPAARVHRGLPRDRARAHTRRRPPRSQAREHHARRLRRGLRARLGHREGDRR